MSCHARWPTTRPVGFCSTRCLLRFSPTLRWLRLPSTLLPFLLLLTPVPVFLDLCQSTSQIPFEATISRLSRQMLAAQLLLRLGIIERGRWCRWLIFKLTSKSCSTGRPRTKFMVQKYTASADVVEGGIGSFETTCTHQLPPSLWSLALPFIRLSRPCSVRRRGASSMLSWAL